KVTLLVAESVTLVTLSRASPPHQLDRPGAAGQRDSVGRHRADRHDLIEDGAALGLPAHVWAGHAGGDQRAGVDHRPALGIAGADAVAAELGAELAGIELH